MRTACSIVAAPTQPAACAVCLRFVGSLRSRESTMRRFLLRLAILAALTTPTTALAQDSIAQFYKGKQITVIVGSSAGGGYDIYARLLARHMPKHLPGNPSVLVSNMPGAGSNAAAAHLFNVAPKDGTYIGAL